MNTLSCGYNLLAPARFRLRTPTNFLLTGIACFTNSWKLAIYLTRTGSKAATLYGNFFGT